MSAISSIKRRTDRIRVHLDDCLARVLAAILIETQKLPAAKAIEQAHDSTRAEREQILAAAAAGKIPSLDLYLRWITESLLELRKIIDGFDLRRLEAFRKQKESTEEFWERPIARAAGQLTGSPSGVYRSVAKIFDDNRQFVKHSTDVLWLANEIRSKAKIVERELRWLRNPFWDRLLSWQSVASLVVLAFLVAAVAYVLRAHGEGRGPDAAVQDQLQRDFATIRGIVQQPQSSWFEKLVEVISLISHLVSIVPNLLLLAALLLACVRTIMLRERWKARQLRALEGKLGELATSLRSPDASSTVKTLASALSIFEKLASEIMAAWQTPVSSRMEVGAERGDLVACLDGEEVKRVTRKELEGLSREQRDYVETLESAIRGQYEIWSRVKPQLSSLSDPVQRAQVEERLNGVIRDMGRDVDALMKFLESLEIELKGQYAHIRHLVKQSTT